MPKDARSVREDALTTIPKALHEHINTAYPAHVCLIGTVLPNGYAQKNPAWQHNGVRSEKLRIHVCKMPLLQNAA